MTLTQLRSDRKKILDHFLLTWELKSCAKWALYGDSDTKYFHALKSGRRNQNSIWSLLDDEEHCIEDEPALKDMGHSHFASIFRDDKQTYMMEQLRVVLLYPKMISQDDAHCVKFVQTRVVSFKRFYWF